MRSTRKGGSVHGGLSTFERAVEGHEIIPQCWRPPSARKADPPILGRPIS